MESNLVLLTAHHASKLRDKFLGQRKATLFAIPADREGGALAVPKTHLSQLLTESRPLSY